MTTDGFAFGRLAVKCPWRAQKSGSDWVVCDGVGFEVGRFSGIHAEGRARAFASLPQLVGSVQSAVLSHHVGGSVELAVPELERAYLAATGETPERTVAAHAEKVALAAGRLKR